MTSDSARTWRSRKYAVVLLLSALLWSTIFPGAAGAANTEACDAVVVYDGKGAGQVVFDGQLHSLKGLTCAECHEPRMFSPALFEKRKGADEVSMRKMELGRSCGYCHVVSMKDTLTCDKCHRK